MAKVARAWGPVFAIGGPALVAIAIGLLGWMDELPVTRAVATALMTAAAGILASIGTDARLRRIRYACATAVGAFGVYAFLQAIVKVEVAPWMRVSPPSAIAFAITGILLVAFDRAQDRARALAIQLIAGALVALALLSLIVREVPAEGLMPWYRYSRMAAGTAVGFIAIGLALMALIVRAHWYESLYRDRADEKILIVGVGILTLVLLGTAAAGFVMMQRNLDEAVHDTLLQSVRDRVTILDRIFDNRITRASILASRPLVSDILEAWEPRRPDAAKARLKREAESYLDAGFTSVRYFGANGDEVASAGEPANAPLVEAALTSQRAPASLLWTGKTFLLRVVSSVTHEGRRLGGVVSEQEIELLPRLQFDASELGETAEWVICAARSERMSCFPTRLNRRPFEAPRRRGERLPMDFALSGEEGVTNAYDYNDDRVIAGYAPLSNTGLGLVLKITSEEVYAPLRAQFVTWIQWFAAMALLGTLLIVSQVRPVAQRLMRSEHLARDRAEALARSESGLRSLYASLADGIVVLRPDGVIEFLNPAAERLFGYPPGGLVGKPVSLLIPEGKLREANALATSLYAEGESSKVIGKTDMVYPALRRDGTRFDLEFSLAEMRTAEGPRLVAVARDISERTELERMKGEFVATVSHELRTPLTSILGSLEILREESGTMPETERGFVDMAWRNSQRLAALVNDVIDSQRLDANTLTFDDTDFALGELLRESVAMNQPYGQARGITMRVDEPVPAASLHADRGRLMQVMANLLSNAAKFSPDGGEVRVRATRAGDRVRVEVIDRGRGIPDEFRARVFEKFAQADAGDSREKGGTGLGLAICKSLIERMGGTIGFDSRLGEATTFWFEMPASG